MTTLSTRTVKILAFALTILSAAIALVTSGAITLDVQVAEETPAVEAEATSEDPAAAPAEVPAEVPALAEPIQVPPETQVVDEAADAPSADAPASDVAVEASGG